MASRDIEIPDQYGAFESTVTEGADTDRGVALDAHILKVMALNNNKMCLKGEQIFSCCFPLTNGLTTDFPAYFATVLTGQKQDLVRNVPVPKNPLANTATVAVRALVPSGGTMYIAIGTTEHDTINGSANLTKDDYYMEMAGTGSWATYNSLTTLPLSQGPMENLSISMWVDDGGSSYETSASYGSPMYGGGGAGTPFQFDGFLHRGSMVKNGATWTGLDDGLHAVEFQDSSGNPIGIKPRAITDVLGYLHPEIHFTPQLKAREKEMIKAEGYYARFINAVYASVASICIYTNEVDLDGI